MSDLTREAITYFVSQKKRLEDFRKIYPSPDTVGYQATTKEISFYDMAISALSENKGKWIVTEVECPFCGQGLRDMKYVEEESTCPKCGADMRGKDK